MPYSIQGPRDCQGFTIFTIYSKGRSRTNAGGQALSGHKILPCAANFFFNITVCAKRQTFHLGSVSHTDC